MAVEALSRCAFTIVGLACVSLLCIQNWASWEDFRQKMAHHHNPFIRLLFAMIMSLVLLNWNSSSPHSKYCWRWPRSGSP